MHFAQPEPVRSVVFVWCHELEVCIGTKAMLRFGLEHAEFSNEKNHQLLQEFPQGANSPAAGRSVWEALPEHRNSGNTGCISRDTGISTI